MKRTVAAVLIVALAAPSILLAKVNSEKAAYFGGSVAMFAGAKDPVEGKLDTVNEEMLILREQVAVLELGKDIVRSTLPIVKARSGKEITYQDEESRKSSGT